MKRSGLITTKMGMTRLYDDAGVAHAVTVLSVGDCTVIGNRTAEKNGYVANVLGVVLTLLLEIFGVSIQDVYILFLDINVAEEVVPHE